MMTILNGVASDFCFRKILNYLQGRIGPFQSAGAMDMGIVRE